MRALGESPLAERDRAVFESFAPLQAAARPQVRPARLQRGRARARCRPASSRATPRSAPRRAAPARRSTAGATASAISAISATTISIARATALTGLAALEPAEAVYLACNTDSRGRPLSGANRYELTFPADGLPPARAFWSLAMYEVTPDGRAFFIDNPIGRYAIGDRTPGLRKCRRRLAHALSAARPAGGRPRGQLAARARPAPMRLVLRAYEPEETAERRALSRARGAAQLSVLTGVRVRIRTLQRRSPCPISPAAPWQRAPACWSAPWR